MSGVFLVARGWMDNPALSSKEPFSRREAWLWMIEQAAYVERKISIGGKTVPLARGQFSHSLRFMAKAWGWNEPAVRRFIERLKTDAMIDAATDAGQLVVTLCNYCKIQGALGGSDARSDAASDAEMTQQRRSGDAKKNEGNEINEGNKIPSPLPPSAELPLPPPTIASPPAPPPSREARGCRLPLDFEPAPDALAWALSDLRAPPDLVRSETERFRDHWMGEAGARGRKANWNATWRNWMRRAMEDRHGRRGGGSGPGNPDPFGVGPLGGASLDLRVVNG